MPSNEFDCRSGYRAGEREGDNERDKATERDSMRERKWGEGLRKRKGGEREREVSAMEVPTSMAAWRRYQRMEELRCGGEIGEDIYD